MSAGPPWTEERLLPALRSGGAHRLQRVRFRNNRRTIWSVTADGAALNLHEGYRAAPWSCVRHFALLAARAGGKRFSRSDPAVRRAMEAVRAWPGLAPALERARRGHRRRSGRERTPLRRGPCCATPAQLGHLRRLFLRLNRERFGDVLPRDLHLRLSSRMRSRLGHMKGDVRHGRRRVVEIALNADLMLEENAHRRVDTLLHEMAHAADWLADGGRGHGPGWKAWARRAGCEPTACTGAAVERRPGRREPVRRVPPDGEGFPLPPRPTS